MYLFGQVEAEAVSKVEGIMHWASGLFVPVLILLLVVAFMVVMRAMSSRYKKVAPNQVLVVYGAKSSGVGFRIVSGGGSLVWPFVEDFQTMSTAAFQVEIDEKAIPNKDNVPVSVRGVASCKIANTEAGLQNAAKAFLGKTEGEIHKFVANILMGHLRSIIGKLDINEILRNRDVFNKRVIEESTEELQRLGLDVITLVIQDVDDNLGYIKALGRKAVAEAIMDADIRVAQAKAATQQQVSDAEREAEITVAPNAVKVAEAQKDRDVQKAGFKVMADTELAKAEKAQAIATADQERILRVKEAERDAAAKEAGIAVQQKEALRKKEELNATVVTAAEAAKQKAVIEAGAAKQVAVINAEAAAEIAVKKAEGEANARIKDAEGQAGSLVKQAEGQATATQRKAEGEKLAAIAKGEGEASMTKATLLAKAEGDAANILQVKMAEAEGNAAAKKLALLGEAEGTSAMAKALAEMSDAARMIIILDRLPALMDKGGEALSLVMKAIFESVAAPMGQIKDIRIVDIGGNGQGLSKVSGMVPQVVAQFLAAATASGVDLKALLTKLGINFEDIAGMVGGGNSVVVTTEPTTPAVDETPKS